MELEKNLKRLIKHYKKDSTCQIKINEITKFVINEISIYEEELEDTYNRYFDSSFKLYSKYIKLLCKYIVAGNIKKIKIENNNKKRSKEVVEEKYEIEGFDKLTITEETIVNNFIILIYSYLLDNIDFDQFKIFVFMQSHGIDYTKFTNINKRAAFSLCNMLDNGMDLSKFAKLGNVQLEFIDNMSNGKYGKESNVISTLNNIAITIDNTFQDQDMREVNIANNILIFMRQRDKVYVYDENDMEHPILAVDNENNYYEGTFSKFISVLNLENTYQASSSLDDMVNKNDNVIEEEEEKIEEIEKEKPSKEELMNQMAEIMAKLQESEN